MAARRAGGSHRSRAGSARPDPGRFGLSTVTVTVSHLALIGPTASGKSALALYVAEQLGDIEIVSVDSMQIYRGLDIGTAKPTRDEQARVLHHLIDVAEPNEDWSVAQFQTAARAAIADIEARGNRALLVGGTGLYVRAVVDDLRFPGEDLAVRAALDARASEPGGLTALYAELQRVDPDAAARMEPTNTRRIVRALEVIEITGQPFSASGVGLTQYGDTVFPLRMFGLGLTPEVRHRRIEARVDAMYNGGLVEEARALTAPGAPGLGRNAAQAIGYREALAVVAGEMTAAVARAATALRTRQFSRRQVRWFRRDPRVTWFGPAENPDSLGPALLECCRP